MKKKRCKVCGAWFGVITGGQIYCGKACRDQARRRREADKPKRQCAFCGKAFRPKRDHTVYCGRACVSKAGHEVRQRQIAAEAERQRLRNLALARRFGDGAVVS